MNMIITIIFNENAMISTAYRKGFEVYVKKTNTTFKCACIEEAWDIFTSLEGADPSIEYAPECVRKYIA